MINNYNNRMIKKENRKFNEVLSELILEINNMSMENKLATDDNIKITKLLYELKQLNDDKLYNAIYKTK